MTQEMGESSSLVPLWGPQLLTAAYVASCWWERGQEYANPMATGLGMNHTAPVRHEIELPSKIA